VIRRFITGLAIGLAATGACYALAATTASHIATAIASESVRSARMGFFAASVKPHEAARGAIERARRPHSQ